MTDCQAEERAKEVATQKMVEAQRALNNSPDQKKLNPLTEQYSKDMQKLSELEKDRKGHKEQIRKLKAKLRSTGDEIDDLKLAVKPLHDAIEQAKKALDMAAEALEKCKKRQASVLPCGWKEGDPLPCKYCGQIHAGTVR